ncbi:cell division protein FtsB [Candidatus Tenderia electrophaga]|jgi:cell division protein FtsB|uniref:Cell division protein FtsB n=1 Tax=Candidatus Tenderia electrophaga TaxID=1748243 RepID=A0A0S2TDB5_9GAMM|nr:cell division protein FtsB [Candidatus Tenderia electrophaga]
MKWIIAILVILLLSLQYKLWVGQGSFAEVSRLQQAIEKQRTTNARLRGRNAALDAEVQDLKKGVEAVEERARSELGMIKKDETFFQIIDEQQE